MSTTLNIVTTILLILWSGILMMSPMMIASRGIRDNPGYILTVIAMLAYPVVIFAIIRVLGLKYFGMSAGIWLVVVSVISVIAIVAYGLPGMLLNIGKGVPNNGYFMTDRAVFLDGDKIANADPKSFQILPDDSRYSKDRNAVFHYGKVIRNADPKSFTPIHPPKDSLNNLNNGFSYWKDQARVYYNGVVIEGCDAGSFELIHGMYGKDAAHVYFIDKALEGATPNSFRFLAEGIAMDGRSLFIYGKKSKTSIDTESFITGDPGNDRFYKDKNNVYLMLIKQDEPLVKVEGADPNTFTTLERSYAKDKNHVYFYGNYQNKGQQVVLLEGAKPETFTIGYDQQTRSEARDGTRHYMYGEVVKQK